MTTDRPRIVVSRCLGFAACRYNGQMLSSELVEKLRPYADFTPICPEVEIGLGIPRNPIRLIRENGKIRLMQPASGRDVSAEMKKFGEASLSSLLDVDGFILKNRSPSCGIKDVKVYAGILEGASLGKGPGFFGGLVLERCGALAVEDEGRLRDEGIREHFLTKLYALARFRGVGSIEELVGYHSENKLLLMAYNQTKMRALGRTVANKEGKPLETVLAEYKTGLQDALSKAPRRSSVVNVLTHAYGYFKDKLADREKRFFIKSLEDYRKGKIPLSSILTMLRMWVVRFDEGYLSRQRFFSPYPSELEQPRGDIFT